MLFGSCYPHGKGKKISKLYSKFLGFPYCIGERVCTRYLFKNLLLKSGDVLLDVGCGVGVFAVECGHKGALVIGVDVSTKHVRQAKSAVKVKNMNEIVLLIVADVIYRLRKTYLTK